MQKIQTALAATFIATAMTAFSLPAMAQVETAEENPETEIHMEVYPDGTTYVNQDDKRYVWPGRDGGRIDCQEQPRECRDALQAGSESGESEKIMSTSSLAPRVQREQRGHQVRYATGECVL